MNTLEILCPFCMSCKQVKTELKIQYDPTQNEIHFDCKKCGNEGVFKREPRKPSLLGRIIQAIKGVWG